MKVTEGLIVLLLALVSNVAARTRGGVRRRGLYVQNQQHAFASAFEAQTQTEFEPFRNLKAGSTDDDGTAVDDDSYGKVSKKGMMMSSKTHAAHAPSVSSSSSSKSDKAERTKAPSPSKAPTPTKAPKEEKASPAPKVERTKAPTPSKAPTATKAPKGEKASPAPKDSAAKAPQTAPSSSKKGEKGAGKTDKGKMDSSSEKGSGKTNSGRDKGKKDSGVVNEDGADDAPDGGSAFLDSPTIEERSLTLVAVEFVTTSTKEPTRQDFEEVSRVTAEIFDEVYQSHFEQVVDVKYAFMELHRYIALSPRLVQFKISSYFHRPSLISILQVDDVATQGLTSGSEFYNLYIDRLQKSRSPVFSTVTSVRFISNDAALDEAQVRTNPQDESSWWSDNIIKVVVPIAGLVLACFIFLVCYRGRRASCQPMTIAELRAFHVKAADRDIENASASDASSTYASEYRTSVFSEDEMDRDMSANNHKAMSEILELSLEEELDSVIDDLEDANLFDEAAAPVSTTQKVSASQQEYSLCSRVPPPSNASVSSHSGEGKPEWTTKKLKTVAKPPAFIDVATPTDTPTTPTESTADSKTTVVPVLRQGPTLDADGRPAWMKNKLKPYAPVAAPVALATPTAPTPTAPPPEAATDDASAAKKATDGVTTLPNPSKVDSPSDTISKPTTVSTASQSKVSSNESIDTQVTDTPVGSQVSNGKPEWMTKKLKSVKSKSLETTVPLTGEEESKPATTKPSFDATVVAETTVDKINPEPPLLPTATEAKSKVTTEVVVEETASVDEPSEPTTVKASVSDKPTLTEPSTKDASKPTSTQDSDGKPAWMTKKLKPVSKAKPIETDTPPVADVTSSIDPSTATAPVSPEASTEQTIEAPTADSTAIDSSVSPPIAEDKPVSIDVSTELPVASASPVEETEEKDEKPAWMTQRSLPVPEQRVESESKTEAEDSTESSPPVPEWMQKFRDMGLSSEDAE